MVFLSKFPIVEDQVRTFQYFRWVDMPAGYLPPDPQDTSGDGSNSYYNEDERAIFRLSSKSHWDIPVDLGDGEILHCLCSHPTPPVFDDGTATEYPSTEVADWNGYRNHDEIRFWADYIDPDKSTYIYDDREWEAAGSTVPESPSGGLTSDCGRFVVLGDQNADPVDGDATLDPILLLLENPLINSESPPSSQGALENAPTGNSNRETKTSTFGLRADYALPSVEGINVMSTFMFWPESTDLEAPYVASSDHHMVGFDMNIASCGSSATPAAWINEIHYDNDGSDQGEFIEVASTPGLDVTAYTVVLYNGNGGASCKYGLSVDAMFWFNSYSLLVFSKTTQSRSLLARLSLTSS